MSEDQKAYHELEGMQELGMLEKGTNICEIIDSCVEEKRELQTEKEKAKAFVELENHMVVGDYYEEHKYKKGA